MAGSLALLVTAAAAGPAPAATRITLGPRRIVLSGPAARVVITADPFQLQFESGPGIPALAEATRSSPLPQVEPPTIDPVPPGVDNQHTTTLYAPLAFTVGAESLRQYDGLVWGGNLMSGARSGVQYYARRVISSHPVQGGVALVLATNDPSGRTLDVRITTLGPGAIRVSAQADPATGVSEIGDSFASGPDEGFFGFGGRHNALNQHGQVLSSFVQEENLSGISQPGAPAALTLFPNGPTAAYYPQAEFFSSRPYGFLLDQPELARFKLDSDGSGSWNVTASASSLDYVVAPGPAPQAMRTLTALSGRQPVPQAWALGPMLDRLVKNVGETQPDYESNVAADLANIARYHLPLSAYRLEGWGLPGAGDDGLALHSYVTPAFQAQVFSALRARHIHPLVYLRPWITPGSAPAQAGLVARRADGQPYQTTSTTGAPIELLDFTNPAAVAFWRREVDRALDLGADGFMQDFGEEVLFDMRFADGETGATMHNRYLVLYAQATRAAIDSYERGHPGRRIFFFSRAGYSGLPGSAAAEGGNFPGDETTDWGHASGLQSLTSDMLSRAVDGAYGFGTDIGGYYDYTTLPTTKPLFLRWAEWAALSPIFRLHGSGRAGTHTPWSYDAQTVRVYNRLAELHLAAVPLIERLWRQAESTGIPPTRPLWLAYPGDRSTWTQDQEWLLGPDVLVAPVVQPGASSRSVYFPAGCWRSPDGSGTHTGPGRATVPAPLIRLPYFFRCGTRPFVAGPSRPRYSCAHPRGRLSGAMLGPVRLGMTRRRVRGLFAARTLRGRHSMDFFCRARRRIRVGYPSPRLLDTLPARERRRVAGRAVLILTANRRYALDGVRPGARLDAARHRLALGTGYLVGGNRWYLIPGRVSRGVLEVRHGAVEEVGIADRRLTGTRRSARTFLRSFF
ncbi:MAG TPA: TIM-barrel domain-containing protein [Solirubrobacteraceae bacterium]